MVKVKQDISLMVKDAIKDHKSFSQVISSLYIISFLDSGNPCMIGQAIWTLRELGVSERVGRILSFINDNRETWYYKNDSVEKTLIGEIAKEAIVKIGGRGDEERTRRGFPISHRDIR